MLVLGKIFADSSFYDDPEQKYPTIEEQIKMARKVALSLSAPDNVTAKGQRMFMRRKEKANYWSTDQSLDGINPYVAVPRAAPPGTTSRLLHRTAKDHLGGGGGLHYNLTPWSVAATSAEQQQAKQVVEKVVTDAIRETLDWYPQDREQSSAAFSKSRALFEKGVDEGGGGGELPWKKASHGSGGPAGAQLYAGLVNDLKGMKGKGAKLFAQKRAKALEEEEEQEEGHEAAAADWAEGRQGEGEAVGGGPRERGGEDYSEAPERGTDVEDASSARRLEELISISRSYLNPWESKAAPAAAATGQAVLTPWQATAAANEAASEQHRARKGRPDAWLQETTDDIPGFIGWHS